MSAKRAKNMKNWAAIRRKSRRIDAARAIDPRETMPTLATPPTPNIFMENVTTEGKGGTGLKIDSGYHVRARRFASRGNRVGIDNSGRFDGPDARFE